MKVLVLNGSPRRQGSSTMKVTNAFLRGFSEEDQVEIVNVADLNIRPCLGCLSCWGRTEGVCIIHNDDMDGLVEKIMQADVIIESYPLFFFGMPGIMKVLTDRLLRLLCTYRGQKPAEGTSFHGIRFPMENKRLIIISTCGYAQTELIYDSLLSQYDCIAGKGNYYALLCPQGETLREPSLASRAEKYLEKYTEAGREFKATFALSQETVEHLRRPMLPERTFRLLLAEFWRREKEEGAQHV